MAILFTDGFDAYESGIIANSVWAISSLNSELRPGRYDGKAIMPRSSGTGTITRDLATPSQTVTIGFAALTGLDSSWNNLATFSNKSNGYVNIEVNTTSRGINIKDRYNNSQYFYGMPDLTKGWNYFEIEAIAPTVDTNNTGIVRVYINSILVAQRVDATFLATNFSQVGLTTVNSLHIFDDFYCTDGERLGELHIVTLRPNSDIQKEFIPSVGTNNFDIANNNFGGAEYLEAPGPDLQDWYGLQNISDVTAINGNVVAVSARTAGYKNSFGPATLTQTFRSGTTTVEGTENLLFEGKAIEQVYYLAPMKNDPNTGAPWTKAAVDAAEIGIKS